MRLLFSYPAIQTRQSIDLCRKHSSRSLDLTLLLRDLPPFSTPLQARSSSFSLLNENSTFMCYPLHTIQARQSIALCRKIPSRSDSPTHLLTPIHPQINPFPPLNWNPTFIYHFLHTIQKRQSFVLCRKIPSRPLYLTLWLRITLPPPSTSPLLRTKASPPLDGILLSYLPIQTRQTSIP